ncbi:MAG: response regulator [Agarilytica sp.]
MKQIDIIKAYREKRSLVVEINPDMRTEWKRMLSDFGCEKVDTAAHAEEAIENAQRSAYDIVLAEYDLGKGKNGQQLLEELRYQGLLKNSAVYFMVSTETAVQHVVHAIEYQPDDYINKPVNRDALRPRLDAAVMRKEAMAEVNLALDQKRPKKAIVACQDLAQSNSPHQLEAKKIMGELLCSQRMYEEAIAVYQSVSGSQKPLWARVGIGKALLGLKKLDLAEEQLKAVIKESGLCVEAQDVLSKVYQAKGKSELAQQALIEAVSVSPMSASRQREMARVSIEANDTNAAVHANRNAIKYSKNSSQESPNDYANLAASLSQQMNDLDPLPLAEEALEAIQYANKKFGRHPVVNMRLDQVSADVYEGIGKEEEAEQSLNNALDAFKQLNLDVVENTDVGLCIDCAKAFMDKGKYDEGEKLLQEVAKLNKDPELAVSIDKLLREPLTKEGIAFAAKLNKKGIEYYKQDKYEQAIISFQKVLKELPNHTGLNLNLIQCLISKSKEQTLRDKEIAQIGSCFKRIGELREKSPYADRLEYLRKRFEKLQ